MFKFLKGLAQSIVSKSVMKDQILFSTDKNQLSFDIEGTGGTVTRYPVKDRTAAKSLSYANRVLTLKDGDNQTLSTVDFSTDPTEFYVDLSDGHLYYTTQSDMALASNLVVTGNITATGSMTAAFGSITGDLTVGDDLDVGGVVTANGT